MSRKGTITNSKSLVFGVGLKGDTLMVDSNGGVLKSYSLWVEMLRRCYSASFLKKNPTYEGCKVSEEWLLYPNFKKWYNENYEEDFDLDKDLLSYNYRGKLYSPETCCFIPPIINLAIISKNTKKSDLPYGIYFFKGEVLIKLG